MTGCVELKIRETCTQVHFHTNKSIIYRHTYMYDRHACTYACTNFQSITSALSLTSPAPGSGLKPCHLATALPGWLLSQRCRCSLTWQVTGQRWYHPTLPSQSAATGGGRREGEEAADYSGGRGRSMDALRGGGRRGGGRTSKGGRAGRRDQL